MGADAAIAKPIRPAARIFDLVIRSLLKIDESPAVAHAGPKPWPACSARQPRLSALQHVTGDEVHRTACPKAIRFKGRITCGRDKSGRPGRATPRALSSQRTRRCSARPEN